MPEFRDDLGLVDAKSLPEDDEVLQSQTKNQYSQSILRSLRRVIRTVNVCSKQLNASHSITGPQLNCLTTIHDSGPISLTALARAMNIGFSTVNGIIDRLQNKDLVRRDRCEQDRRKVLIRTTEKGEMLLKNTPLVFQNRLDHALQTLPELEQATIALALERIAELMEVDQKQESKKPLEIDHNFQGEYV